MKLHQENSREFPVGRGQSHIPGAYMKNELCHHTYPLGFLISTELQSPTFPGLTWFPGI